MCTAIHINPLGHFFFSHLSLVLKLKKSNSSIHFPTHNQDHRLRRDTATSHDALIGECFDSICTVKDPGPT
ncbi:hypothetical protein MTR67_017897 [Solanum verrucosum]|uniref:Uncharacterized protein n=1 Tax=Solanum verrucosum TaxID=315347 RepID=A0AAF0QKQ5_SOLVR|nr:hypothetical protein MTR67_017897 [Solanum verrucosum]